MVLAIDWVWEAIQIGRIEIAGVDHEQWAAVFGARNARETASDRSCEDVENRVVRRAICECD